MTQEDKDLILRDMCARLPYGVKGKTLDSKICTLRHIGIDGDFTAGIYHGWLRGGQFIPYLRPLSSMTEEEMEEMHNILSPNGTAQYGWDGIKTPVSHFGDFLPYEYFSKVIDWLNANHFDFRGLIPRGCAIAVTEDNNPYKD